MESMGVRTVCYSMLPFLLPIAPMHTGDEVDQCVCGLVNLVRVLVKQPRAMFEEFTIAYSKPRKWYKSNVGDC